MATEVIETTARTVDPPTQTKFNPKTLTPGHRVQHECVVLALRKDGHRIACPQCGATAVDLGEIDTRAAESRINAMVQQAQLDEFEPDPIIRNRNLYPDCPVGWQGITFDGLTIDANNREPIEFARAWAETPGGSLVLMGETGRGKTHILAAVVGALQVHDADISPWTWGSWSDTLRGVFRQDQGDEAVDTWKRRMFRAGVLIIDDVLAEQTNRSVVSMFEEVVDARWAANLATLITTNASKSQWRDWSARSYSRLDDISRGMWLTLTGPDRRRVEAES